MGAETHGGPGGIGDRLDRTIKTVTRGMKTAISLPDAVFPAAERQARRAQKTRSQLYAEALAEYLSRHAPDEVTEAKNRVIDSLGEERDAFTQRAAQAVLERVEW